MVLTRNASARLCGIALLAAVSVAAGRDNGTLGIEIYPGAEGRPAVARAVEAYYRSGLSASQSLRAAVFETPADFAKVSEFYSRQMDDGKWGWRTKRRVLRQHTETLSFMRAQLLQARSQESGLAQTFKPLFGDLSMSQDEFRRRLARLHEAHKDVTIHVAEGTRTIRAERGTPQIRVTVERPYVDLDTMTIVDNTRFILVEVADR